MSAEYGKPYILAARGQGSERGVRVARRHVLKNVAVPVVTLLLFELGRVFVGHRHHHRDRLRVARHRTPGRRRPVQGGHLPGAGHRHGGRPPPPAVLNLLADLFYFAVDPRTRHLVKANRQ